MQCIWDVWWSDTEDGLISLSLTSVQHGGFWRWVLGYLSWRVNRDLGSCFLFLVVAKCFFIVFVNKRNTGVAFISSQIPCTLTQAVGWYSSYSWNHAVHLSRACQRTHSWKFSTISWDLSSLSLRYSSSGGGRSDSESDWGLLYQCQDTTNSQLQWVCFSISTYMLTHC